MPIFEYYCDGCGKTFEMLEKYDRDKNHHHCSKCFKDGKDSLAVKKISASNFIMKGYNYKNGYSKKGEAEKRKKEVSKNVGS
jgi:putative FmdB family regulatory protein